MGSHGLTRADVERIKQRHIDFAARYSPGPDWQPASQMHDDIGALLAALLAAWDALLKHVCFCGPTGPDPGEHREDCLYRRAVQPHE